ncbi:MAG: SURF1 family protein [Dongiaceae bacterium]
MQWKTDLLSQIAERQNLPPRDLNEIQPIKEFTPIKMRGHFTGPVLHFPGKAKMGEMGQGYGRMFATQGKMVLVYLGFGPSPTEIPALDEIERIIRLPPKPNWFTPPNQPEKNIYYSIPAPFYIAAKKTWAAPYPQGADMPLAIPNNHLSYAFTWYGLALILLIIYRMKKP